MSRIAVLLTEKYGMGSAFVEPSKKEASHYNLLGWPAEIVFAVDRKNRVL